MEFPNNDALEVLDALAANHPGTRVEVVPSEKTGHAILRLLTGERPLITVREPPDGWPVIVHHHHANPKVKTIYALCGPGYQPGRARIPEDHKLSEAEEYAQQQEHTPIDSAEKLFKLCEELLGNGHTSAVKAHAERAARRAVMMPAVKPK